MTARPRASKATSAATGAHRAYTPPSLDDQHAAVESILSLQRMVLESVSRRRASGRASRLSGENRYTLLLKHGRLHEITADSFAGRRAGARKCYENATLRVMRQPDPDTAPALWYAEGIALFMGVPIDHAWCVDAEGRVIDPTFKPDPLIGGYLGIAFEWPYVRETLLHTEMYGLLDGMTNPVLYDEGLPPSAIHAVPEHPRP